MPRFNKAYFPLIHSSCPKHCAARLSVLNIITVPGASSKESSPTPHTLGILVMIEKGLAMITRGSYLMEPSW